MQRNRLNRPFLRFGCSKLGLLIDVSTVGIVCHLSGSVHIRPPSPTNKVSNALYHIVGAVCTYGPSLLLVNILMYISSFVFAYRGIMCVA